MEKQIDRLKDTQTELTEGYQWRLALNGKAIPADRVLELEGAVVSTPKGNPLFKTAFHQVKVVIASLSWGQWLR